MTKTNIPITNKRFFTENIFQVVKPIENSIMPLFLFFFYFWNGEHDIIKK